MRTRKAILPDAQQIHDLIAGYSGDGNQANRALCNEPYEVRFDVEGNMFFVEMQNHVVRRVDAKTSIISTVAGTGTQGFAGDGEKAVKAKLKQPHSIALDGGGGLFIADIGNNRIRRVDGHPRLQRIRRRNHDSDRRMEGLPARGVDHWYWHGARSCVHAARVEEEFLW